MNQYITGSVIKELREKNKLTQTELAEKLGVSDKTVSKWERARGYPDITLLEPISEVFGISVAELLSGKRIVNTNVSANMALSGFYVCPVCGNVIHSTGEAVVICHGVQLTSCEAEPANENHPVDIKISEDEYFVRVNHDMTKKHYIMFIASVSDDGIQMVRLYPEGKTEARLKINGVKRIYYYCNRDGLFYYDIKNLI